MSMIPLSMVVAIEQHEFFTRNPVPMTSTLKDQHPKIGERVLVIPRPGLRVQRGDSLWGQFLSPSGQEVLWDEFLHQRLQEGAIRWEPISTSTEVVNADSSES